MPKTKFEAIVFTAITAWMIVYVMTLYNTVLATSSFTNSTFLIVLKISFAESIFGQPPYSQLLEYKDGVLRIALYLESYITLFSDSLFVDAYLRSIRMAVVTTLKIV